VSDQMTVLDALLEQLARAAEYNSNDQVPPAVILWPDSSREWVGLLPMLRERLPQLLTLGEYAPDEMTGPAIWLRCVIAGTLDAVTLPGDATPIIYLPGVSRQDLRAVEDCPRYLQPLVELQYRGVFFSQVSSRDWTVLAFLVSEDGGLGLDVATDNATAEAMARALPVLARTSVGSLRGRRLEAVDFDELVSPDDARGVLVWLNSPDGTKAACDANQWGAFRSRCAEKYGFNPETDGELVAAERLGRHEDKSWDAVWRRYTEAPTLYPNIPDLLRRARGNVTDSELFFDRSAWPSENERLESELRAALTDLTATPPPDARKSIIELEKQHGERRGWVWAVLGQAPLAQALDHLARMAHVTQSPAGGSTPEALAEGYASGLWQADAAALDAPAAVEQPEDIAAVKAALESSYVPWLMASAEHLQQLCGDQGLQTPDAGGDGQTAPEGVCILFADGLRYDVGQKLKTALDAAGLETEIGWRFSAIPTVTATAKPAASPVAAEFRGADAGADFNPVLAAEGKPHTAERLRQTLTSRGYAILSDDDTGTGRGAAWTEIGALDSHGHDEGWKLARRIDEEVRTICMRVQGLLAAGWREVRIITDHGWLLVPGELPKQELPAHLTETRWGRCAALKTTTKHDGFTLPWHWNSEVRVALAAGIGSFFAGKSYAHGGISLQECVVPVLTVISSEPAVTASIEDIEWINLRCRVHVVGGEGLQVDLRTKVADGGSSIASQVKSIDQNGAASLFAEDDSYEGSAVHVVVLTPDGQTVTARLTTVGGDGDAD
jgi:hypothetical protein